jgi:glycosyltransferase involved in cell wall biosynthesis
MTVSKTLFVGHDANRAGAQLVLLNWLKERKERGLENYLLLVEGGSLLAEYKKVAQVWVWTRNIPAWLKVKKLIPILRINRDWSHEPNEQTVQRLMTKLKVVGFDNIIGNTVSSVGMLRKLESLQVPVELYVHELRWSITNFTSEEDRKFMAQHVRRVYAVSELVKSVLHVDLGIDAAKIALLPPIVEIGNQKKVNVASMRKSNGIPANAPLVLGCGLAEWRKGPDIFLDVAKRLIHKMPTVHFIWLGLLENEYSNALNSSKAVWDIHKQVHLLPVCKDTRPYFDAMDVFFLSSREDPFPLVMLEAAQAGKPIVGVRASGGINDFLKGLDELLVADWNEDVLADKLESLLTLGSKQKAEYEKELKRRALQYSANLFMDRWSELHSN